jgi:hypothetical protein
MVGLMVCFSEICPNRSIMSKDSTVHIITLQVQVGDGMTIIITLFLKAHTFFPADLAEVDIK